MPRTRIKICGVTSPEDAELAIAAGADAIGMILAASPRRVSIEELGRIVRVVPPFVTPVAVIADPLLEDLETIVSAIQLGCVPQFSGAEPPEMCERIVSAAYLKAFHVGPGDSAEDLEREIARYPRALPLFDTRVEGRRGGTGTTFDWDAAAPIAARRRAVMSGGLTPENVGECVRRVRPYAVDVRSGVEREGKKDAARIAAFVRAVREADAES